LKQRLAALLPRLAGALAAVASTIIIYQQIDGTFWKWLGSMSLLVSIVLIALLLPKDT